MSDLLNSASLVMIPSGYKEDTVYSVVPSDGSGDLQFTRSSNGTRVNSAGLVEVCPWNLVEYSEDFSNAVWVKQNAIAVTANTTTAPNGTTTADTLEKASGSGGINYYYIVTSTNSFEQLTNFFYVKHKSGSGIVWLLGKNTGTFAFFDVINGTALSKSSGMTTSVESVGNGWYKCIFSQSYVGATSTEFGIGLCLVDGTPNYDATSAATQSVYIWGAQSAVGSTAKPYFPTTDRLNVPRLTYQNGGGGCPSLLLEKQSTNLLIYSEQFDQWATNGTTTSNVAISPDGTQNADRLNYTSGSVYWLDGQVNVTNGVDYTYSLYVKPTSIGDQFRFYIDGAFNVSTTITTDSSDWKRYTWTFTASATGSINPHILLGYGYTSQNTLVWGAQLEASSYPTSYIPTTSSSATRVADACFKTGISSLIGQSQGTIFIDFVVVGIGSDAVNIYNNERSAPTISTNAIIFQPNGLIECQTFLGNGTFANIVLLASTYAIGQRIKLAYRYKSGDFALYVNGIQKDTDSTTMTFVGTKNAIELDNNSIYYAYQGGVQYNQLVQFPTPLTNAELVSLTTL